MADGAQSIMAGLAKRLEGKVAIITGGASGIGECAARLFALHGAKVVIADIQDSLGRSVCSSIGSENATYVHCDVTKEPDVAAAVAVAVENYGKLDIMYNNAGIVGAPKPMVDADISDFNNVMGVVAGGAFLGTKHAARVMIPRGTGSIISTASVASVIGGLGTHTYVAAKHALLGLTKSAAVELGRYGIRVNCVSPFAVATGMTAGKAGMDAGVFEAAMSERGNLKGRVLKPEDIANAALYLASDESQYVSGLNLMVDGGFSIVNPSLSMGHSSSSM